MRALVRDYSRAGDLVCDPLAGFGSTLIAALAEDRRAIGAELDTGIVAEAGIAQLRAGDWHDVLADIGEVDTMIADPPYSERTHDGAGRATRNDGSPIEGVAPRFDAWTRDDVHDFVRAWSPRCRGWIVALADHVLIPHYEAAFADVDRFAFAPVPCVIRGMTVRKRGDGPSSWTVFAMVARPRSLATRGTLPGAYVGSSTTEEPR